MMVKVSRKLMVDDFAHDPGDWGLVRAGSTDGEAVKAKPFWRPPLAAGLGQAAQNGRDQAADIEVVLGLGHAGVYRIGSGRVLEVLQDPPLSIYGDDMAVRDRRGDRTSLL